MSSLNNQTAAPKTIQHIHHHITVGPWTVLAVLGGLHLVMSSVLSLALIQNPQSLRVFLETMRGAPATSMVPPPYTNGEHTGP